MTTRGETVELSAWMRAAEEGDAGAVTSMLDAGADPNTRTAGGETALMRAASRGRAEVVGFLLERGADPDARRRDLWTALMLAAFFGHEDAARALLQAGADPTCADRNGTTALGWAASRGHVGVARLIRDAEARAVSERRRRAAERAAPPVVAEVVNEQTPPRVASAVGEPEATSGARASDEKLSARDGEVITHDSAGLTSESENIALVNAPMRGGRLNARRLAAYAAPVVLLVCAGLVYKFAFLPARNSSSAQPAEQQTAQPVVPIQTSPPTEQVTQAPLPEALPSPQASPSAEFVPAVQPPAAAAQGRPFTPYAQSPSTVVENPSAGGEPSVVRLGQSEASNEKPTEKKAAQDPTGTAPPTRTETEPARTPQRDITQPGPTQSTRTPAPSPTPRAKVIPWP